MRMTTSLLALVCGSVAAFGADERFNHEGRMLGDLLTVPSGNPILFNTPEADDIVETMQIMPRNSAWNEDISGRPLLGNSQSQSDTMIDTIRTDLGGSSFSTLHRMVVFQEMNYVLVPDNQPLVGIRFVTYPGDSDYNGGVSPVATWPVPSNMPIETWPTGTGSQTLVQWQRATGGDRHSIIVRPGATPRIFETWQARLTNNNPVWQASNGAIFPLDSNDGRTPGDTSGDAAGLPMFPALVRYDECQRGVVEHAMRIVVKRSRQSYIYPASHQAGSTTALTVPAMGQRVRLKASFTVPPSWSTQERAVAVALQKYGALVADNGNFFSVSICPDHRWPDGCWDHFSTGADSDYLDINNFDVIETTGEFAGPRAANAPTCNAGADQVVTIAAGASLVATASPVSGPSAHWDVYPTPTPPGTVTFGDANALSTSATFSAVGTYRLRLKVSDTTHTPAYDAVVVTVAAGNNPVPTLSSFTPITKVQNSGSFTLTVNGSNFVPSSRVVWTGRADLLATSASGSQLTVTVPGSYLATAGTAQVAVQNPLPGGGTTSSQTFTITADTTAPVISAMTAGSLSASGATITWTTNESATTQVDYGTTIAYGSSTTLNATLQTSHSQSLSALSPSTTYHYRVRSSDGAGNPATSVDGTFTTVAPSGGGGSGGGSGGGGGCGVGALSALLMLGLGLAFSRRFTCGR